MKKGIEGERNREGNEIERKRRRNRCKEEMEE
jgi:hypothetical protein